MPPFAALHGLRPGENVHNEWACGLPGRMHDGAGGAARWHACARIWGRHPQHRRVSGPSRRSDRLRDGARRRHVQRRNARLLGERGRRHARRAAAARAAARSLHDPDRFERRAAILLLARRGARPPAVRAARHACDRGRAPRGRNDLSLRDHALAVRRRRAGAAVRAACDGARGRGAHRLRQQLPAARLAGSGRRPCRFRAHLRF